MANQYRLCMLGTNYILDKTGYNTCVALQDKNTNTWAQALLTLLGGMLVAEEAAYGVELRYFGVRKVRWVNRMDG